MQDSAQKSNDEILLITENLLTIILSNNNEMKGLVKSIVEPYCHFDILGEMKFTIASKYITTEEKISIIAYNAGLVKGKLSLWNTAHLTE